MVCTTNCAIAAAFLGGMLWIMLTANKDVMNAYKSTMTEKQLALKNLISVNRAILSIQGFVLGTIVATVWLFTYGRGSSSMKGCVFAAIAMAVNYFYYMLSDKGTYMVQHLEKHQIDEWLGVKKMMQRKYHIGMLLGLAGCFFLGKGLSQ
jgi:hypothetical protein